MLPRLEIPSEWRPPPDGEAGWEVGETPREGNSPVKPASSLPSSPSGRKTKSRAARAYMRTNSLKDAKVLMVSDMHRTESVLDPSLFQYHQHFDSPWHLVGKTHLSEVFRVRHRVTGQVFAVKRSRRRFRSKLQRERCLREIRAVAELPSHLNIVNQYRAWQEGGHFYIQMDYCEGGSLAQHAQRACAQGRCMPDEQLWSVACQAAQGLCFLHSHRVLHLDIKPDNIYLSGGAWRIGDFGLAVARDKEGSMDWEEGDGDYVAPELLQAGGEPSPAADIFSLGATLYECATGCKLPRSDGWGPGSAEQLELPHHSTAFVQLLRAMLQPNPELRPTAAQVVEVVAREQPAVAAAAAEAVLAAAAAQVVAAAAAAAPRPPRSAANPRLSASVAQQQQQQASPPMIPALVPSPFQQIAAQPGSASADAPAAERQQQQQPGPAAAAAANAAEHFSFDVPQQQQQQQRPASGSSLGLTPGKPLRAHNRRASSGGAPPGSAVKCTPAAGRSRMGGRWAPQLSPLISEGALTPGAAAALAGLTPGSRGSSENAPTPVLGPGSGSASRLGAAATPLDLWRPAPLLLPPHTAGAPTGTGGSGSGMLSSGGGHQPSSSGTGDSRDGWRLSRRDIVSPDSDVLNGSQSESEYSYSCGTGKTMSDLDFADALSPMSQEMAPFGNGHTPSTGTPDSLLQRQEGEEAAPVDATPDSDLRDGQQRRHEDGGRAGVHSIAGHHMQAAPGPALQPSSLAWDLHTSPEFLMQLPPGSPDSLSRTSSLDDAASLPSSRLPSVRRFPTLDSWGSRCDLDGATSKPSLPHRVDSLAALAAQRFTSTFAAPEQQQLGPDGAAAAGDGSGGGAATGPMLPLVGRGLRKRQHSSRRTLIQALSRDNSIASSIDGMQPLGKTRHIMDSSAAASPDDSPRAEGGGGAGGDAVPPMLARGLLRTTSSLGREAAAEVAAAKTTTMLAAAAAGGGGDCLPGAAATPSQPLLFMGDSGALDDMSPAGRTPLRPLPIPASPLHARLTCMKLRDSE